MPSVAQQLKVADEVWIAAALLHREDPKRADFTVEEILERAAKEARGEPLRPGFRVHVNQHCVANRPPNPARYRMLFQTKSGRRRLFRTGDSYHPDREGAKVVPDEGDMPAVYSNLLDWYALWSQDDADGRIKNDPLLALRASGKQLWSDEHADKYLRRLREGWQ